MMEDPKEPTILGLSAAELHAAGYGLLTGLKFWQRKPVPYDEVDRLPLSPEWKDDIKKKYHYYWTAFDLPEDIALVALVLYFGVSNLPALMALGSKALIGGAL